MFETVSTILVCFLSVYIIASFYTYSRQGDIDNSLKGLETLYHINDKDEIVKKLFEHSVALQSIVRWPVIVAVSIVSSIIITYATSNISDNGQKFFIILPLIFAPIYASFNFLQAHGGNNTRIAINNLNAIYQNRFKNPQA